MNKYTLFKSVGERFDMSKSSLSVSFMRVVEALNDIAGNIVQWPKGERLTKVKQKFQELSVLPDIIGAIDVSYRWYSHFHKTTICKFLYLKKRVLLLIISLSNILVIICVSLW